MNENTKILELSNETQLLITASYQLESPMEIAKELLDNAIDAGASEIEIAVSSDAVSCEDNGSGFSEELLTRIFRDRVTTKGAGSFGFRGEALFLIAQVANVIVESNGRRTDSYGNIDYSNVYKTRVTVTNIFHNVPVRERYFAQAANFEQIIRQRIQVFEAYAISFDVSIKLSVQSSVRFNTFNQETRYLRFIAIFGGETDELLLVDAASDNYSFEGQLSSQASTRKEEHLFIFINKQFVLNTELYTAINETYRRYNALYRPNGFLFIEVPAPRVSFNYSNDKLTAKLMGGMQIVDAIRSAYAFQLSSVQQRLVCSVATILEPAMQLAETPKPDVKFRPLAQASSSSKSLNLATIKPTIKTSKPSVVRSAVLQLNAREPALLEGTVLQEHQESSEPQTKGIVEYDYEYNEASSGTENESSNNPIDDSDSPFKGRYVGQYNRSFLLLERAGALLVIDEHALDEAIRFEALCNSELKNLQIEPLIGGFILDLSPHQLQLLRSHSPRFYSQLGFEVNEQALQLNSVPVIDGSALSPKDFVAFVDALQDGAEIPPEARARLVNRACKSAVKLGDPLSDSEARRLLAEAARTQNAMNCPHGRKTVFRLQ